MVSKWADYVITAVSYDTDKKHIVEVNVFEDDGGTLIKEKKIPRKEIVDLLNEDKNIITAYKGENGYSKGDNVGIIEVRGTKFIRTDGDNIEGDNLGELPEF